MRLVAIYEEVKAVTSPTALAEFVRHLSDDFGRDTDSWENLTIDAYLEAISGWLDDSREQLNHLELPAEAWQTVAQTLYIGKIFE
jgi:hypothetical protein